MRCDEQSSFCATTWKSVVAQNHTGQHAGTARLYTTSRYWCTTVQPDHAANSNFPEPIFGTFMRQKTWISHILLYMLVFLWAGYRQGVVAAPYQQSNQPALTIGTMTTAPGNVTTLPVAFQSNGANIGASSFSITFDDSCLTYNSHAILAPATHSASFANAVDLDGDSLIDTLNVLIFAFAPTPVALPATVNPLLTLNVTAKAACAGVVTPVIFSGNISFSDANTTLPVPGSTTNGAITITGAATATVTATPSPTVSTTPSATPPASSTATTMPTAIPSITATSTSSPTQTPTQTSTPTASRTPTLTPTPTPVAGTTFLLISTSDSGSIGGFSFKDEDILSYDPTTKRWAMLFDGSDVGLGNVDLTAFDFLSDGSLLLTVSKNIALPGLGTVMPADILRFTPTQLGPNTAGSFAWYFDGSDVELTSSSEEIDALALDQNGRLLISTTGTFKIGNTTLGEDEDLFLFAHTRLGADTAGAWSLYLDGSRLALTKSDEDLDAAWLDPRNGDLYLSTKGKFTATGSVNSLSGGKNDLFICTPLALAAATDCRFTLFLAGNSINFKYDIDDLSLVAANSLLLFNAIMTTNPDVVNDQVNDQLETMNQYPVVADELIEVNDDPELTVVDQDEEAVPVQRILLPIILKQ
jgi:hypothetical protein